MKIRTLFTVAFASVAMLSTSAIADIVYQDNFDNDGIATNTGIGGGLVQFVSGAGIADDGNLTTPSAGHNSRGNILTASAFDLTGGFSLSVSYDLLAGAGVSGNASRSVFGLVPSTALERRFSSVFFTDNGTAGGGADTIAFVGVHQQAAVDPGLWYEGAQVDSTLGVDAVAGFQDVVLTVQANGTDYSYSVDGVTQSGTLASAFDFSQTYRFEAYYQDAETFAVFESVTLETLAVPEPTSLGLLGLGALGFLARRRRS